jgi:hypothetical protein
LKLLLDYITPDADLKEREAQKKTRAKVTEKLGQNWDTTTYESHKEEEVSQDYSITRTSSDKENKSEAQFQEQKIDRVESTDRDKTMFDESNKSKAQVCQETRCLTETPPRPPPHNPSTTVQPSPVQSKSPDRSSKLRSS